jgi:hypothetical protein
MISYFDYIFYRMYTFYKKKGDGQPIIQSLNFISISQLICIFTILQLIDKLSSGRIKVSLLDKNTFWVFWASLIVLVYVLNVLKYVPKDRYKKVVDNYCNSPLNIKLKMWMIFIQPVVLLIITITLLVLTKHHPS